MDRMKTRAFSFLAFAISLYLVHQVYSLIASTVVVLPIWDDFDMGLRFFTKYREADGALQRGQLLLEQHNEHRVVVTKTLVVLSHALFSSVNFEFLVWCSFCCLVGVVALLSVRGPFRAETLLIASAVLLQPQYGDGLTWSSTSVSSFAVCLLALATGHFAFKSGRLFLLSLPSMGLAVFTQGNGILLPTVIVVVLLLHQRWKQAFVILVAGVALVAIYFKGYTFLTHNKPIGETLAAYPLLLEYGFTLLGNSLGFSQPGASLCAGIIVAALFVVCMFSRQGWANPAVVSFALFLFLSGALTTLTRGLSGVQYALSPGRYTILSAGIVASLAILVFLSCRHTWQRLVMLTMTLVFNYLSWAHYRYAAVELNARAINDFVLYMLVRDRGLTYPWPNVGIPIFEEALAKGTFNAEYAIQSEALSYQAQVPQGLSRGDRKGFKMGINRVEVGGDFVVVEGWGIVKGCESSATDVYVLLQGTEAVLSFKARPKWRTDIGSRFKSADRERAGYITMVPRRFLDGQLPYKLDALFVCDGKYLVHDTPYRVDPRVSGRVKPHKSSASS